MFAHYSTNSGICAEYSKEDILNNVKKSLYFFVPIIYEEFRYPDYYAQISDETMTYMWDSRMFMYKNTTWKYEREWRIIAFHNNETEEEVLLRFHKPRKIFLGTNHKTTGIYGVSSQEKDEIEQSQAKNILTYLVIALVTI